MLANQKQRNSLNTWQWKLLNGPLTGFVHATCITDTLVHWMTILKTVGLNIMVALSCLHVSWWFFSQVFWLKWLLFMVLHPLKVQHQVKESWLEISKVAKCYGVINLAWVFVKLYNLCPYFQQAAHRQWRMLSKSSGFLEARHTSCLHRVESWVLFLD